MRIDGELEKKIAELVRANERLQKEVEQRKQTEDALRESDSNFRTLDEHSTAAIFIIQGDKFVYINFNFTESAGYTLERR